MVAGVLPKFIVSESLRLISLRVILLKSQRISGELTPVLISSPDSSRS